MYYLSCIKDSNDVRSHNREAFGLEKLKSMPIHQVLGDAIPEDHDEFEKIDTIEDQKNMQYMCIQMDQISEESYESSLESSRNITNNKLASRNVGSNKSQNSLG